MPAEVGDVRVRIVRPAGVTGYLPVIVYMHGGGWILGNAATHDRLVRELAVGARAALLFVEYPDSPEAHYPVAIEQGYATAQWVMREGRREGLDAARMAVAGESVGGNMAAALSLIAKERGDVRSCRRRCTTPVTDAAMDTASYDQFAEGYYLTARRWSGSGTPTLPTSTGGRNHRLAQPGHRGAARRAAARAAAHRRGDRLRDEGEARRQAARGRRGTTVRYDGVVHDFMLLEAVKSEARGTRAAIGEDRSCAPRSGRKRCSTASRRTGWRPSGA